MTGRRLSYALVTPARDEAENLRRLAACVEAQSIAPTEWIIVDNGSIDDTFEVAQELARRHPWIRLLRVAGDRGVARGAPVVRAFVAGLASLSCEPDVIVKLDADVSFSSEYFERLLAEFRADPLLGIASGTGFERDGDGWREDHGARNHVRGATRAYRQGCLEEVMPLEERMGWDGVDELKATVRGWRTMRFRDLAFYHHRPLGKREGASWGKWVRQGDMAHYMGYRLSYLMLRAVFRARRDPLAPAMLWGYVAAVARRKPQLDDVDVRDHLRREQRLRSLPMRLREVSVRRASVKRT